MKQYDYRFDKNLLRSFVGKTFNRFVHPQFIYTKTATMYIGFMIDNVSYCIENDYESLDYFGWDNEATVTRLYEKPWQDIVEMWKDKASITEVQETIESITVINDHYSSFSNDVQNYDYWETRAIIFHFKDHEVAFTKSDCWFSMEIEISKGHDLLKYIPDGKFILDDFTQSKKQTISTEREIYTI